MKGIFKDYKEIRLNLQRYKELKKVRLFSLSKLFKLTLSTFKSIIILLLLLFVSIVGFVYFNFINVFGTTLYFGYLFIYLLVVYIIVNITFILKNKLYTEYANNIKNGRRSFLRILYLYTFISTVVLVFLFSIIEIGFIQNYVNPPLAYCSYYDQYGNNLVPYEFTITDDLCHDVEIIRVIKGAEGELSSVEIEINDNKYRYVYSSFNNKQMITQKHITLDKEFVHEFFPEYHPLELDSLEVMIRYDLLNHYQHISVFGYAFNKREPVYTLLNSGYYYSLNRDRQLIEVRQELDPRITFYQDIEVSINILGSKYKVIQAFMDEYNTMYELPFPIQSETPIYLDRIDSSIKGFNYDVDEDSIVIYNFAFTGDYETIDERYFYQGIGDDLFVIANNANYKYMRYNEQGDLKVNLDKENVYTYQVDRTGTSIRRIDQLKGKELMYRHLFTQTEFGYKVMTNSYNRNADLSFKKYENQIVPYHFPTENIFKGNLNNSIYDGSRTALFYQREPLVEYIEVLNIKHEGE